MDEVTRIKELTVKEITEEADRRRALLQRDDLAVYLAKRYGLALTYEGNREAWELVESGIPQEDVAWMLMDMASEVLELQEDEYAACGC